MKDYIVIGSSPCEENCAQVGTDDYDRKSRDECNRFIRDIRLEIGPEPEGARLRVKTFQHDFGPYKEVVCEFEEGNEAATSYAFKCESECPANWRPEPWPEPVIVDAALGGEYDEIGERIKAAGLEDSSGLRRAIASAKDEEAVRRLLGQPEPKQEYEGFQSSMEAMSKDNWDQRRTMWERETGRPHPFSLGAVLGVPVVEENTRYDIVQLADDEWGNDKMAEVAKDYFATHPDVQFVLVREHAGWWLGYRRDLTCWGTANDQAVLSVPKPLPTDFSGEFVNRNQVVHHEDFVDDCGGPLSTQVTGKSELVTCDSCRKLDRATVQTPIERPGARGVKPYRSDITMEEE